MHLRIIRLATSAILVVGAVVANAVAPALAGPPIRIWADSLAIDFQPLGTLGHGSTASSGNRALVAWVQSGQVEVSERNPVTRAWGAKVTVGTSSGPTAAALGADGSAAVAYPVSGGVEVVYRPAGSAAWTTKHLSVADAAAARFVEVTLSSIGDVTVMWLPPLASNGVRVGYGAKASTTLARVTLGGTAPVSSAALVEQPGHAPVALWLPDGAGAKIQANARGAALSQWTSPTVTLGAASSSLLGVTASMTPDGLVVAAWSDSSLSVGGVFSSTRSSTGTWSAPARLAGTDGHVAAPSVAATAGGAATVVWSRTADEGPITGVTRVWVSDRSATAAAWAPKVELPVIEGMPPAAPAGIVPGVARGTDGTWFVTWSGYGATNGYVPTFLGKGGVLKENDLGGIYSDDNDVAFAPMLLADGTAVHAARVVEPGFTGWAIRVREGRLFATGPVAAKAPALSGTARVGGRLTCTAPAFTPTPASKAYAWLRNGVAIPNAKSAAYVPVPADLAKSLRCRVTATTTAGVLAGSTAAISGAVTIVRGVAPKATAGSVAVLGVHKVGVVQRCRVGTWSPSATYTHTFRWLRDGVVISGATAATYVPPATLRAHRLACRVTSSRAGYATGTATSAAVPVT